MANWLSGSHWRQLLTCLHNCSCCSDDKHQAMKVSLTSLTYCHNLQRRGFGRSIMNGDCRGVSQWLEPWQKDSKISLTVFMMVKDQFVWGGSVLVVVVGKQETNLWILEIGALYIYSPKSVIWCLAVECQWKLEGGICATPIKMWNPLLLIGSLNGAQGVIDPKKTLYQSNDEEIWRVKEKLFHLILTSTESADSYSTSDQRIEVSTMLSIGSSSSCYLVIWITGRALKYTS